MVFGLAIILSLVAISPQSTHPAVAGDRLGRIEFQLTKPPPYSETLWATLILADRGDRISDYQRVNEDGRFVLHLQQAGELPNQVQLLFTYRYSTGLPEIMSRPFELSRRGADTDQAKEVVAELPPLGDLSGTVVFDKRSFEQRDKALQGADLACHLMWVEPDPMLLQPHRRGAFSRLAEQPIWFEIKDSVRPAEKFSNVFHRFNQQCYYDEHGQPDDFYEWIIDIPTPGNMLLSPLLWASSNGAPFAPISAFVEPTSDITTWTKVGDRFETMSIVQPFANEQKEDEVSYSFWHVDLREIRANTSPMNPYPPRIDLQELPQPLSFHLPRLESKGLAWIWLSRIHDRENIGYSFPREGVWMPAWEPVQTMGGLPPGDYQVQRFASAKGEKARFLRIHRAQADFNG